MDKDQIRQNLSGYRPELYQDDDPLIAESLRVAKADPELSAWLDEQIAFDRDLAKVLSAAHPPQGSREALLAAHKEQQITCIPRKRIPTAAWATAAILLISAGGLIQFFAFPPAVEFVQTSNPTVETLREQMAYFASQRFVLDETFATNAESAQWLATEDFPTLDTVPGKLVQYKGMGCKKITWQSKKIGLICFKNKANEIVHLFVIDEKDLDASPQYDAQLEKVLVRHDRETKGWRDENQVYLLVGSDPGIKVGNLL